MKIPMPTENEKKVSIDNILNLSMMEHEECFGKRLTSIIHNLGIKNMLFNITDCIILALIVCVSAIILILFSAEYIKNYSYAVSFITAPIFYGIVYSLTRWKEMQHGTLELAMTYKFSMKEVGVIRMMCFGVMGFLINIAISIVIMNISDNVYTLSQLIAMSFLSLAAYGLINIMLLKKFGTLLGMFIVPCLWVCITIFMVSHCEIMVFIVDAIPTIVIWAVGIIVCCGYVNQLKKYLIDTSYVI